MSKKKKSFLKSKTVWLNICGSIITIAAALPLIDGINIPIWIMPTTMLVTNVVLRFISSTPIGLTED